MFVVLGERHSPENVLAGLRWTALKSRMVVSKKELQPGEKGMVKGGTHIKTAVSILKDKVIKFERCQKLIAKRKPPVPKIPKLSKNGLPLGRRPDLEKQKKKQES